MAMNRLSFQLAIAAAVVVILAGGGSLLFHSLFEENSIDSKKIPKAVAHRSALSQQRKMTVYLYFSDDQNAHLVSEDRILLVTDDPLEIGRSIIQDLIQGPRGKLVRTIPIGTTLNAIYISKNGTAFVDFSDTIREKHPGGSQTELLTVYSIVNSIVLNIPQVQRVKILIDGREVVTLSGHIDVTTPLPANMILVR